MATIVLSAAGMALGGSVGGSVLGLSAATLGRAAGAALGRSIDARLLGSGSDPVETGRVDRFRLTGAGEGAAVAQLHGVMRLAGQVIWASPFEEHSDTSGGGKGAPSRPKTTSFSYSVSLAVALCEGPITRVGRIWADGVEIGRDSVSMRVYEGGPAQRPDPKIEAVEGVGMVPGYRGIAYVVIEDLDLGRFGNRVPQLSFEVFRPSAEIDPAAPDDLAHLLRGVALIPGTGEYALATRPLHLSPDFAVRQSANLHTPSGQSDMMESLDALTEELPNCDSVSLVVSWFGDDLRAGHCTVRPKAEQGDLDAEGMRWQVSGLSRGAARLVPRVDGRSVYGGTPADASVIEAIREMNDRGLKVVFYPFILMDQLAGNGLPDPYGRAEQPALPWRGRITTGLAPGQPGTSDRSAAAEAEVAALFGSAAPGDFSASDDGPVYHGPEDWGLRRFTLHCAHLCAQAGGVDAFCIGSELRGVTTIRGAGDSFPAVEALRALAADVRAVLGADTRISYAADWSEYHGYQPGGGTKHFHLDPLWADPEIDFIGIDNYMPLSDWRDGAAHLDAGWGSIYDLDYLTGNVAGGEGYDWYYASEQDRAGQIRSPITDEAESEPWVWRYKDLKGWWGHLHYDRIDGVRGSAPTAWQPRSKPIWFTEIGCAAVDRGTNQPNKFLDPKSSESSLPHHSRGYRDDFIQMQYLRAIHRHFADPAENPVSEVYAAPMVDTARMLVWAWDARPHPWFPADAETWSDGDNWARGHWLTGRSSARPLSAVVEEICGRAGVTRVDTSHLWGLVRGYVVEETGSARAALQPLMLAYGFDAIERDGVLVFRSRDGLPVASLDPERLVEIEPGAPVLEIGRAAEAELAGRVRIGFVETSGDYEVASAEAVFPGDAAPTVSRSDLPLALTRAEALRIAERWLAEARLARETAEFALPPSCMGLGAGDVVLMHQGGGCGAWRIDRVEQTGSLAIEAVRVEPGLYQPHEAAEDPTPARPVLPPMPVEAVFLDLPLLTGDEVPHAPHFAATARPWPGTVALLGAPGDADYRLKLTQPQAATIGTTLGPLAAARAGIWDRGPALRVRLARGRLASASPDDVLAGANVVAIGSGDDDLWEVFQFAEAELVAPGVYDLRQRLRGQAGTDGVLPPVWPAGSRLVLLDGVPQQIELPDSARGLERHYRFGPARRPIDDPSYRYRVRGFDGIGLRPYSVCHLKAGIDQQGLVGVSWIRRSRIGGDSWSGREVPLSEAEERYLVRVTKGGLLRREAEVTAPRWNYDAAQRAADDVAGDFEVEVSQLSEAFGPGPVSTVTVAG